MKKRICIFASGSGSNALNLIKYYKKSELAEVTMVLCNRKDAGVIAKAENENVPVTIFSKFDLENTTVVDNLLAKSEPDIIVLAGFLLQFPKRLLQKYPNRVVNIHPALLPLYGGKGMYGIHVHTAVMANNEKNHGVTVHLVNEEYDKGEILSQESFAIEASDNLESLQTKIHEIEFRLLPKTLDSLLLKLSS